MQIALRKPRWLDKKINLRQCQDLNNTFGNLGLHTVCKEASCPNISECFEKKTATFMILGSVCTRNCRFCNVESGTPDLLDEDEPEKVAEAVRRLGLRHAVITSVTRDDLDDGGADIFAETIKAIRDKNSGIIVEVLIPDFKGQQHAVKTVLEAAPDIVNHNIETVPRLYAEVRPQADYGRSLSVLKSAKELSRKRKIFTKSGIMVGLGETKAEVLKVFSDLRQAGCDFLSIGQYLAPSRIHYPVKEYVTPAEFEEYKRQALDMGFLSVASGPYVRSSYMADKYIGEVR